MTIYLDTTHMKYFVRMLMCNANVMYSIGGYRIRVSKVGRPWRGRISVMHMQM